MKPLPMDHPPLKLYKGGGLIRLSRGEEKAYAQHYKDQGVEMTRMRYRP